MAPTVLLSGASAVSSDRPRGSPERSPPAQETENLADSVRTEGTYTPFDLRKRSRGVSVVVGQRRRCRKTRSDLHKRILETVGRRRRGSVSAGLLADYLRTAARPATRLPASAAMRVRYGAHAGVDEGVAPPPPPGNGTRRGRRCRCRCRHGVHQVDDQVQRHELALLAAVFLVGAAPLLFAAAVFLACTAFVVLAGALLAGRFLITLGTASGLYLSPG